MASEQFLHRVTERDVTVAIVGLGYVGLPLATEYADTSFRVIGYDLRADRVADVCSGRSYIEDVDSDTVARHVESGLLEATSDPRKLADADAIFVSVPTPFDESKTPDLSFVRSALSMIAQHSSPGCLVILQSTTYPGTTREVALPILEQGGRRVGTDFFLAFSPERVDPGNRTWRVHNTPKVVAGITPDCTDRAVALLAAVADHPGLVSRLSTPEAAEMTKLLENTYRAVNIALVNELAVLAHEMGIDIWEVIEGASTKPFGFQPFTPGTGPGGHCIPVDPYYLSWRAKAFDFQTKFIELAADTNLSMARYVFHRVQNALNQRGQPLHGARLLALGASFKPGIGDIRNSRAVRVMEMLVEAGAEVEYADPYVDHLELGGRRVEATAVTAARFDDFDMLVMLLKHPDWDADVILDSGRPIFDAVNALGVGSHPNVERL